MTYIIFMRHSWKEYNNNRAPEGMPEHDPPIILAFQDLIKEKATSLFNQYGKPDVIYSSPFLRARQTSQIIKDNLEDDIEIVIDKDIEEYLGFQHLIGKPADIDPETQKYTRPLLGVEHLEKLRSRASRFYNKVKQKNKNILVITHGILISQLAKELGFKHEKRIKELEGIIVYEGEITLI